MKNLFNFLLDNDPNKQQQPPTPPPFNIRILTTVFFLSLILAYLSSSQKQREANGLGHGYITWNEFVQDMLSKGEVRSETIFAMKIFFIQLG